MEGRDNPDYRWLHAVNLLLLLGPWVFTIIAYPRLPEQIPAHIGTSGVTCWTDQPRPADYLPITHSPA